MAMDRVLKNKSGTAPFFGPASNMQHRNLKAMHGPSGLTSMIKLIDKEFIGLECQEFIGLEQRQVSVLMLSASVPVHALCVYTLLHREECSGFCLCAQ